VKLNDLRRLSQHIVLYLNYPHVIEISEQFFVNGFGPLLVSPPPLHGSIWMRQKVLAHFKRSNCYAFIFYSAHPFSRPSWILGLYIYFVMRQLFVSFPVCVGANITDMWHWILRSLATKKAWILADTRCIYQKYRTEEWSSKSQILSKRIYFDTTSVRNFKWMLK
jgi:hypothetical protein